MRCLVDAQLPPALARWLASQGHDATHVVDLGMTQPTDTAIWAHALAVDAIIIAKDEDFCGSQSTSRSRAKSCLVAAAESATAGHYRSL